jgi:L-alanine-DL-glutamate epimerase-like enolase superfamily enzyme
MSITDISAIPVAIDVVPKEEEWGLAPYVGSPGPMSTVERVLIRLETDSGTVGWGETSGIPTPGVAANTIEEAIAPDFLGREVWEIESILSEASHFYVDYSSLYGGVEVAMWDALGKELGAPLHQLLGGKCVDEVECAYCVGILDPEESREHVRRALDGGFSTLKTKGGLDWEQDVERLIAMDDEADGQLQLRLDPNEAYSFEEAVRVGARLEDAGVYLQYLEQPIDAGTFGTYKRLRERLRQPIAVNEDMYEDKHLLHLVTEDAIDVGVVDLLPAGGVLELKRMAGIAADAGVSLSHHSGWDLDIKTAAMVHTVASTPAVTLPPDTVYYSMSDYLATDPFDPTDAHITVPDGPGLGIEVDEAKVEEYRTD